MRHGRTRVVPALVLVIGLVAVSCDGFSGPLQDVSCTAEDINQSNKGLNSLLTRLIDTSSFFSIFKVNLLRDCPFWPDDGMCTSKESCGVECCGQDEIPVAWRAEGEAGCVECKDDPKIDKSVKGDTSFTASDENVWTIQEEEKDMEYVDLRKNLESYTGYRGDSARRAWTAIYDENCFTFAKKCVGGVCEPDSCKEERVLYRLISGIHSSITMSIVKEFLYKDGERDLEMYQKRVGYFDDRKGNLYFLQALITRAIAKSAEVLASFDYATGDKQNDEQTEALLREVWEHESFRPGCLKTFDESDMFQSDDTMKLEFRTAFRNISSIMDCVGCEKCKLWGKVQFLGLGTALKLLFEDHLGLQRNELIALFQTLKKTSDSVLLVQELDGHVAAAKAAAEKEAADKKAAEELTARKADAEAKEQEKEQEAPEGLTASILSYLGLPDEKTLEPAAAAIFLAIVIAILWQIWVNSMLEGDKKALEEVKQNEVRNGGTRKKAE